MKRVFISYKRADKKVVFPLKEQIEEAIGESSWIDMEGIESDAQFANVIIKAIDEASVFLFMYSKSHAEIANYEKDWTVREITYAQSEGKRIVFVNIDQTPLTKWFKLMFGLKQQVDATSEQEWNKLLRDLQTWLEAEPKEIKPKKKKVRNHKLFGIIGAVVLLLVLCVGILIPYLRSHSPQLNSAQNKIVPSKNVDYFYDDKTMSASAKIGPDRAVQRIIIPEYTQHEGKEYVVRHIAEDGFSFQEIIHVALPVRLNTIENNAFKFCSLLDSVTIPHSVTTIGNYAFYYCNNLTHIKIQEGITHIGEYAFASCKNLKAIDLPNSLTRIERFAFNNCDTLKRIDCKATTPPIIPSDYPTFTRLDSIVLYVPRESINAYKKAKGWRNFPHIKPLEQP